MQMPGQLSTNFFLFLSSKFNIIVVSYLFSVHCVPLTHAVTRPTWPFVIYWLIFKGQKKKLTFPYILDLIMHLFSFLLLVLLKVYILLPFDPGKLLGKRRTVLNTFQMTRFFENVNKLKCNMILFSFYGPKHIFCHL